MAGLGYPDLVRSLLDGRFWVAENTDSVLASLANPYDYNDRKMAGAFWYGDTAYFNGFYYIYFGITPALLFFLPYYLLTGQDMSYYQAEAVLIVLICVCSFWLVSILRKRIAPRTPWKITMLLSIVMSSLSGVILFVKRAQIYYTTIATALMLVALGLCLWLESSTRFKDGRNATALLLGVLGSFSLALAVGARPQFALASFSAFVIYRDLFTKIKKSVKYILVLVIPYIIVGAFLMYYNYARFGSVFDFGANYNMTWYDMTNMGIHPTRILIGIWDYLFSFPRLSIEFPYIIADGVNSGYPGYMVFEPQIGGALVLLPISFTLFALLSTSFRGRLRNSNDTYKNNIWLCGFCVVTTIIVVTADTMMCGILTRYQMDYRVYILLASIVIAFMMVNVATKSDNNLFRIVAIMCFVSILFGLFTVLSQYEEPDYVNIQGYEMSVYLKLRELFGFVLY